MGERACVQWGFCLSPAPPPISSHRSGRKELWCTRASARVSRPVPPGTSLAIGDKRAVFVQRDFHPIVRTSCFWIERLGD